jgi:hypothetical protein
MRTLSWLQEVIVFLPSYWLSCHRNVTITRQDDRQCGAVLTRFTAVGCDPPKTEPCNDRPN